MSQALNQIQRSIESYYQLTPQYQISNFLLSKEDALEHLEQLGRAGLVLDLSVKDTLNIGVFFEDDILDNLENLHNSTLLHANHLDSLWVAIEEVSHYLLLLERISKQWPTTHIEMEFQAEIDKVIFSWLMLEDSFNSDHSKALIHLLFDQSKFIDSNSTYKKAHKLAERFWRHHLADGLGHTYRIDSSGFKVFMRQFYRTHLSLK